MEEVKAGILFQDGCVLQREKEIPVWGEGPEGAQLYHWRETRLYAG